MNANLLLERLQMRHAIIQAPMAGGMTTPALVAAVSNAGALGSLAGAMLSPDKLLEDVRAIRALTPRPFGINLFVLETPTPAADDVARAIARLDPIRAELGLPPGQPPARFCEPPAAQFDALCEAAPALASFTFGVLPGAAVERLHRHGIMVMGTATHVAEAIAWQDAGADAVCVQGAEAGGHRGTFIGRDEDALIGLAALLPEAVDAVKIPVVAAGGIMDGRGIAAALTLGACAAQLGTAFLATPEAGVHPAYRERLLRANATDTRLTRAFSGRMARGIANTFMDRMADAAVPAYPVQNALTGEIRKAAAARNNSEYMSLWAGQGVHRCRTLGAGQLVCTLADELARARHRQ